MPLGRRLLVLSPHCDDAVLSLGATISHHVRQGGQATVVTVFAGDPSSTARSSPWDQAAGFAVEGAAAVTRRREDLAACRVLKADVIHLGGRDQQYRIMTDLDAIWALMAPSFAAADEILLPGYPLQHVDHKLVTELTLQHLKPDTAVRLYVEEPYAHRLRGCIPPVEAWLKTLRWAGSPAAPADIATKLRALSRYESQLKVLTGSHSRRSFDARRAFLLIQLLRIARQRGEWLSEPVRAGALATFLRSTHAPDRGDVDHLST